VHEATLAGREPPHQPRAVIADSWRRVLDRGVDPDRGGERPPLEPSELDRRRELSGLLPALPGLRAGLTSIADEALHIMVVVGCDGRVLWREGSSAVRRRADGLGFVEGAAWDEATVGTNAIGTALVARRPVQVYSAEHYVRTHHVWTCAAAPVHDPRSGRLLGVVDVSGPAATVHASTLALVDAVAHLAQTQLRQHHHRDLERLRAVAAPVLARIEGRAVVTDPHGWLVAATGLTPTDRILMPEQVEGGLTWLPAYGACQIEPLPGGWLIRIVDTGSGAGENGSTGEAGASEPPTRVVLDLRSPRQAVLCLHGPSGSWEHALSPRHAELLTVLATQPQGRSAADLAEDLLGDATRTVTVRAELSRLRRHLGGILAHRPYRFVDWVQVELRWPDDPGRVLPHSSAPAIRRLRDGSVGVHPA